MLDTTKFWRPRLWLAIAAGVAVAVVLAIFWPVTPRAVLPAVLRCEAVFFAPDSSSLVTMHWKQGSADQEGALVLWDTATGQERRRLFEDAPFFKHIAFSADGRKLAGRDSGLNWKAQVHVWDLDSGRKEAVLLRDAWRDWGCTPVAFSPAGKVLVFDPYRDVMVDAATGLDAVDLKRQHGIDWGFRNTGFDDHVLFSNRDAVYIVRLGTGELCATFQRNGMLEDLSSHAVTADGKVLVAGLATVQHPHHIFDARTGEVRRFAPADGMSWLALSPDGRWLAGGGTVLHNYGGWRSWLPEMFRSNHEHAFEVYDLAWGWHSAHFPGVTAAKFSPDGRTLALIAEDETVRLYDFPFRTPWLFVILAGVLSAGIVYLLTAIRFRRRYPKDGQRPPQG